MLGTASIKNDVGQLEAQLAAQDGLQRPEHHRQAASRPASCASASCRRRRAARGRHRRAATAGCLQLRDTKTTKYHAELQASRPGRPTSTSGVTIVDDNKTPDDPTDDLTYTGVAALAARRPHRRQRPRRRFNAKLATTAPGYNVVVEGIDGFTRDLHERRDRDPEEQARRRRPRERRAAHAGHRLDQERDVDESPAGSPTGRSSWSPATRASSAAASRPASRASASCRRCAEHAPF